MGEINLNFYDGEDKFTDLKWEDSHCEQQKFQKQRFQTGTYTKLCKLTGTVFWYVYLDWKACRIMQGGFPPKIACTAAYAPLSQSFIF